MAGRKRRRRGKRRPERPDVGQRSRGGAPDAYRLQLFPVFPTDGFGRFMCLNIGARTGDELWRIREAARESFAPPSTGPTLHQPVLVRYLYCPDKKPADAVHYALCLQCLWLRSRWGRGSALELAAQHASERARRLPERGDGPLSIPVWQFGDGEPCWFSPEPGRHHAHADRDPVTRKDFAECVTCGWRLGPFRGRDQSGAAAYRHMEKMGGPPKVSVADWRHRGIQCPRPFPPPELIVLPESVGPGR